MILVSYIVYEKFIERQKKGSKYLVLGAGARKTFRLPSRTPF